MQFCLLIYFVHSSGPINVNLYDNSTTFSLLVYLVPSVEEAYVPFLLRVEVGVESVELVGDRLASTAAGFSGRGGLVWNTQHTLSLIHVCAMKLTYVIYTKYTTFPLKF